jgi:hypothetical protein
MAPLPRAWPLLFPLTYLFHIAEEYWCGERFFNWASRLSGIDLTEQAFLGINAAAWSAMLLATLPALWLGRMRWVVIPLAAAVLLNGIAHVVASVLSASYSPGLVTGLMLWVPLGAVTLVRARDIVGRDVYWLGVAVGLLLHGLVTLAAVTSG